LYLAWVNRDEVRRIVHRLTAEGPPPPPGPVVPIEELRDRALSRLDSLANRRADSVVLPPKEVSALVTGEVRRRAGAAADSVAVELLDGAVAVRAIIDAAKLPKAALGPLGEWISGRQPVEVRGPVAMMRLGAGQWRIDRVSVRGLPLPERLWGGALGAIAPGSSGSIVFPIDQWITGLRVTPEGAILYGRVRR
jgi:hypothetical protein